VGDWAHGCRGFPASPLAAAISVVMSVKVWQDLGPEGQLGIGTRYGQWLYTCPILLTDSACDDLMLASMAGLDVLTHFYR
jgi:hypothetical protein